MLEKYARNFVDICASVEKNTPEYVNALKGTICIESVRLREMLHEENYAKQNTILHVWRNLGWLISSENELLFTKKIYIGKKSKIQKNSDKKYENRRMVVLNRASYKRLSELFVATNGETLERYISEFFNICAYIEKRIPECINAMETRAIIEPERLKRMLDKNLYQESLVKLRSWRDLGLLLCDTDKERLTKTVYSNGKTKRMSVINWSAFNQLAALQPED